MTMKQPTTNQSHRESPTTGTSLRQQAFWYYDLGWRPTAVAGFLDAKPATLFRYFQDWKKEPPYLRERCRLARKWYHRLPSREKKLLGRLLATELGTSERAVVGRMRKPWALRDLVTGQWRAWAPPAKRRDLKNKIAQLFQALQVHTASRELQCLAELARESGSRSPANRDKSP